MKRKPLYLIALLALSSVPMLFGCGSKDPTETAAPPPSANAPAPINASQTKRMAGTRGMQGGGMTTPMNTSKPIAKPAGM